MSCLWPLPIIADDSSDALSTSSHRCHCPHRAKWVAFPSRPRQAIMPASVWRVSLVRRTREVRMFRSRAVIFAIAAAIAAPVPAMAEDVLVTQYKADPSGAPYGVGIDKGFFKQAGVDITGVISGEGGGSSVRATIASDLGYGETSPAGIIAAINEGQDIKIVDIGSRSMASNVIIVMPNSPIKTMADLKGKKFAISNPKSLGEMTAVLAAENAGINPNDVQRVALGNLSGALTALENNVVDATSIPGILFLARGGESKYRVIVGP